jgi:hypothetical protein
MAVVDSIISPSVVPSAWCTKYAIPKLALPQTGNEATISKWGRSVKAFQDTPLDK